MRKTYLLVLFFLCTFLVYSQKKPLDHSVYDGWQSIGERAISNDGKWIVYSINPQEGDNELVIQSPAGNFKRSFERGYGARITEDSRYVIFKIKPLFAQTREARIKKKRPDDMPKDSFCVVELGKDEILRVARVRSFKTPEKEAGWVAWHLEKPIDKKAAGTVAKTGGDKKLSDSLTRIIDSLQMIIQTMPEKKKRNKDEINEAELALDAIFAEGDELPGGGDAGTDLVIKSLDGKTEKTIPRVLEYYFSEKGGKLVIEQASDPKDSLSSPKILLFDLKDTSTKVLSSGGNEFKSFRFSEDGSQLAYLAERDARPKELQKFFKVWFYRNGMDSAIMLLDKNSPGMRLGMTVSEHGDLSFSKSGKRLFFGSAPIQAPKDTTLVDIDLVKLDIWHYNEDYLQTQQLSRLQRDLQDNYLTVFHFDNNAIKQLGTVEIPTVMATAEGDGDQFVAITDYGNRVESQWAGNTKKDIYVIDPYSGERKIIKKGLLGVINPGYISPSGNIIMWYEYGTKQYFAWDGQKTRNLTSLIKVPLWQEDHDSPGDPFPYGLMGWHEGDSFVYLYDRYDIWKVDPVGKIKPRIAKFSGLDNRKNKTSFRYQRTNPDERYFTTGQEMLFRVFNQVNKKSSLYHTTLGTATPTNSPALIATRVGPASRALNARAFVYTKEDYINSPNIYYSSGAAAADEIKLTSLNVQQSNYNWGTAELYKWKAFNGLMAEGVLFKPEDFDPSKKYPVLLYFYETHSDDLYAYMPPSPTPSRLNIPFFVSRGYIVLTPDIHYTKGKPAKSAYDYVVSAAKDLSKHKWIDSKNIGIQGQSWGGIQVAQLITMTDIFKAAWAGAPVANMTSAYGGIRWESGSNRQFQYEKTQSRIGGTLWEKQALYIENSPLFHVPKIKTPLVIMANDNDGAVPWYQGIELFTAMRRLGKKVWMLNYNGEAHNLVERKNRKDIQIREQQYFDWLLKGAKPPKWIVEGVPATKKGKDWGLDLVD